MIKASKKGLFLERVLYIYYLLRFQKNNLGTKIFIDTYCDINTMTLLITLKAGLKAYYIDIKAHKIESSTLKIFEIVLSIFWIKDKLG